MKFWSDEQEHESEARTQDGLHAGWKSALMFLKMYSGLSSSKLTKQLNGNIHYQLFCDVRIDPLHSLTNYKLPDDVILEMSHILKSQQQQDILTRA